MSTNPEPLPPLPPFDPDEAAGIQRYTPPPAAGITTRQEFGSTQVSRSAETSSTAVAAQVQAEIQARTIVAIQRPRDLDDVRVRILKECRRPGFAKVARYAKPIGNSKIEGPSIRFAEAAIRLMGNLTVQKPAIYEDAEKRIVRVSVVDLETNTSYSEDVTIEKTVERRQKKAGDVVLGERLNSSNQTVYILRATEDDFMVKENARVSKAIRTLGLRLLPGDILEDAMRECVATAKKDLSADPEGERKKIMDAFAGLGIEPSDIKGYVAKELAQLTADDLVELRALFTAIKDGDTTWRQAVDAKLASAPVIEMPKRKSEQTAAPAPTPTPVPAPAAAPAPAGEAAVVHTVASVEQISREKDKKPPYFKVGTKEGGTFVVFEAGMALLLKKGTRFTVTSSYDNAIGRVVETFSVVAAQA